MFPGNFNAHEPNAIFTKVLPPEMHPDIANDLCVGFDHLLVRIIRNHQSDGDGVLLTQNGSLEGYSCDQDQATKTDDVFRKSDAASVSYSF